MRGAASSGRRGFVFGGLDGVWLSGEEFVLGEAAVFEAREDFGARVVPAEDLAGGVGVVAGVELFEQRGGGQAGGSEVVGEIDQRVELGLGERDFDQAGDGLLGGGYVGGEKGFGLGLGHAAGEAVGGADFVAVTDGEKAGGVLVGRGAEAFGLLDEVESCGA